MRHSGLPLATSGSRASNTPCPAPLCPKRRPPRPQQPIFSVFHRSGLHFGHHATTNATSPPPNERNFATRASDTSATRAIHHKTARTCSETLAHGASLHPGYRTCRVAGFVPCMPWCVLLVRTWACYSEPGQPRPRTEQTAHVRNSGFTCGMRWSPDRCRTRPIHDGSWGSHTQARDAVFTGRGQTRPTKIATFPPNKAEKSPQNQHVLSFNPKNPTSTSAQAAGGPGCDARGRRQGLAGQRADAPSEARGADGERAGRRPRAHQAAQLR